MEEEIELVIHIYLGEMGAGVHADASLQTESI